MLVAVLMMMAGGDIVKECLSDEVAIGAGVVCVSCQPQTIDAREQRVQPNHHSRFDSLLSADRLKLGREQRADKRKKSLHRGKTPLNLARFDNRDLPSIRRLQYIVFLSTRHEGKAI